MLVTNELPVDFSMLSALVKEFFSQNGCPPELEARLWELTVDAISNLEAEAGLANAFRLQFYKDLVRLFENFEDRRPAASGGSGT
ncbi:hypothetical protein [Dyadobacter bucti]|uniref:hypothetical protein n=1 Tax=Dyadobacter bucti TaxID=2572203 RepID=UPI003F71A511